jgi:collagen type I/II/III/V/XI/XXIV/XXVII alpha
LSGSNIVYDATTNTYYSTLSSAITGSSANDVLLVSGTFVENFPTITHSLTIQSIGTSLVSLSNPQPLPPNNRAVLDAPFEAGVNLTISGLNIFGANNNAVGIDNGAAILFEVGNGILTVNHSWIHGNQDGILTGGPDAASPGGVMSAFIGDSEIDNNGLPPSDSRYGFDHNIYAGSLTELSVTGSYLHDALGGHEIKSRALTTIISNNRIVDGSNATTSYSVDVADGGIVQVTGNVIEKGANSPNENIVHFGGEGTDPTSSLLVDNNAIINDRVAGATLVLNQTQSAGTGFDIPATITNNTIYDGNGPLNLTEDDFPPVTDTTSNNAFVQSAGPVLSARSPNTSHPLAWTGAAKTTDLSNATNWNDLSGVPDPAPVAPGPFDTVQFSSGGGTLTNAMTVSAAVFTGFNMWTLGSAAAVEAFGNGVTVGSAAGTSLVVAAGGKLTTFGTGDVVAAGTLDHGTVNITGSGANWTALTGATIGASGTGIATVLSGGTLVSRGTAVALALGANTGARGSLTVSGATSAAILTGQLNVGQAGTGSLTVSNHGTLTSGGSPGHPAQGLDITQASGGAGGVHVTGSGSLLNNTGEFIVGDAGLGGLVINAGGTVSTSSGSVAGLAGAVIANTASASGSSVNVSGAGSNWQVTGSLLVGNGGQGLLSVSQGASVTAASADLAAGATGDGVISVAGTGSALTLTGSLTVGGQAAGELSVLNGATVSALDVTIGNASAASSGNVDVEGQGSTLLVGTGGVLNIGVAGGGSGVLTVGAGSTLNFTGTIVESGHASFNNNGGVIDPDAVEFTTTSNGGTGLNEYDLFVGNIGAVQVSAGTGTWLTPMVLTGTSAADADNNINNNGDTGQWQLSQSGTFIVNANTVDAGQAIVFEDATDTLVIGQVVNGGSAGVSGQVPTIAPGAMNLLQAGGFDAQIWGYQAGDKIDFNNLIVSSDSIVNGTTLDLFDSSNTLLGSLTFFNKAGNKPLGLAGMQAAAAQIACFAEGTMIETVTGPRRVESLAVGDEVVTLPGGARRIVWVGSRNVDCERHPRPEAVWPVRITAGAFGQNVPARDLFVSPDHAIYVDRVLVPAKLLIDGFGIVQVKRANVNYYHLELEDHALILAEGLTVESYLDTGDRANFGDGAAIRLFPDFGGRVTPATTMIWETRGAAPLVMAGVELARARAKVVHVPVARSAV